jgi:hypothetical protein
MSLRILADQCVPASIAQAVRSQVHLLTLLRDLLPIRSPDTLVIAKATELGLILLSLNGDFADIVAYPPSDYRSIPGIYRRLSRPRVIC